MEGAGLCRLGGAAAHIVPLLAVLWALGCGFFVRSVADLLAPLPPGDAQWTLRLVLTWGGICGLGLAAYAVLSLALGDVAHALGEWGPDPAVMRRLGHALRLCAGGTGGVLVLRGVMRLWGRFLQQRRAVSALPGMTAAMVMGVLGPFSGGAALVGIYAWRRWGGTDLVALAVGAALLWVCWQGVTGTDLCILRRHAAMG